eukprot:TRINITY_DN4203_c0_g1_i1.p1 TRINITY_DN4203_c0_g1~~TRINITY_DN4203_c0_g1_i1.p1  ORF type:complete len:210 (-),score=20.02 TRINITY_DN4203_c0_g1_i1:221-850(-)
MDDDEDYGYNGRGYTKSRKTSDCANRFLFSNPYTFLLFLMIFLNLALLIWELLILIKNQGGSYPKNYIFMTIEILVNVTLLIDIIIRIAAQQKKYCKSPANIFDIIVLFFSVGSLVIYLEGTKIVSKIEDVAAAVLLSLRYVIVLTRVILILRNHRNKRRAENGRVIIETVGTDFPNSRLTVQSGLDPIQAALLSPDHDDDAESEEYFV